LLNRSVGSVPGASIPRLWAVGRPNSFGLWQVLPVGPITLMNNASGWIIQLIPMNNLSTTQQIQLVTNGFSINGITIANSFLTFIPRARLCNMALTPPHNATDRGHQTIVKSLPHHNANPNTKACDVQYSTTQARRGRHGAEKH